MIAYKLLRVRRDGTVGPLFINKNQVIPMGEWLQSGNHPTPGFAVRPGWHVMAKPEAPHLKLEGRKWFVVEVEDYEMHQRPASQGGKWFLANRMKVLAPLVGVPTVNKPSKKSSSKAKKLLQTEFAFATI